MARTYVISANGVTIVGSPTLVWLNPGTSRTLRVVRAHVSQRASTTAQMCSVAISRQVSGFPTVVSATPQKVDEGDPASVITGATTGAAGTCGINSSAAGAGAKSTIATFSFLNTAGWDLWLPDSERIVLPASSTSGFALHLTATPSSLTEWNASLWFEEV